MSNMQNCVGLLIVILILLLLFKNQYKIPNKLLAPENFQNRHITFCNNPKYNEWRPGASNNHSYRGKLSGKTYRPFSSDKSKCKTVFQAHANNYNNQTYFSTMYEAWLYSSQNKVDRNLKNKFYNNFKKTLEWCCKIRGTKIEEFTKADLDACMKNFNKGPDSYLVFYLLSSASKICDGEERPASMCLEFQASLNKTIESAREVRSNIKFVKKPEITFKQLVNKGGNARNLGECEGDCDRNSDCLSGLKCFQRGGYEKIPGCKGNGKRGWDYCYDPNKTTNSNRNQSKWGNIWYNSIVKKNNDIDNKYGVTESQYYN
jgi:hypothetical protein